MSSQSALTLDLNILLEKDKTSLLQQHRQLNKKRLKKDLRIASIALSTNSIMVTRNYQDFSQIPNLIIEDWTV